MNSVESLNNEDAHSAASDWKKTQKRDSNQLALQVTEEVHFPHTENLLCIIDVEITLNVTVTSSITEIHRIKPFY